MFHNLLKSNAIFLASKHGHHRFLNVFTRGYVSAQGQKEYLNKHLKDIDPEVYDIIEQEKRRQRESIVLIPSE
ncbi:8372_t:CDS:2, partial [Dentiscutata erythropus]